MMTLSVGCGVALTEDDEALYIEVMVVVVVVAAVVVVHD